MTRALSLRARTVATRPGRASAAPALLGACALAALAACGSTQGGGSTPPTGGGDTGGGPVLTKAVVVAFGTEALGGPDADPPKTKIWLAVTDETGAARSHPVGEIDAGCSTEPGGDMGALGTLRCWWAGGGANFIAVARGGEVIVLRQWTDEGMEELPDYEELTRVIVPAGAKLTFQP